MRTCVFLCIGVLLAPSAFAEDVATNRDIQNAVDHYLAIGDDAALVGGAGSAGYDAGFWIRGGDFLLRINATLQARFEAMDWDDEDAAEPFIEDLGVNAFAGDTSGFSLPRATLKFSGEAPCQICWYMELEFGHFGRDVADFQLGGTPIATSTAGSDSSGGEFKNPGSLGPATPLGQTHNYDNTREAWIEWCSCPSLHVRMGQVRLPTTRQMMVAPELQQFVDVSLGSSYTGFFLPGYTDRNRDHGILVHGVLGCSQEWSYIVSITNGDGGDSVRNVLDHRTSDNLAYGARVNWAFLAPIGYEEGALRQQTCRWYGEAGVWALYYADRRDKNHLVVGDVLDVGIDLALGYGGFSFTGAYNVHSVSDSVFLGEDLDATSWLAQLGYHFPGTAWELAARASAYEFEEGAMEGSALEYAFAVNYYLNGHGNKLQLDVSFMEGSDWTAGIFAPYPGYLPGLLDENSGILLRFQWQLAL